MSELGFSRVGKPSDVLTLGQEVTVQVLRVEKSDDARRPEKVALSLKALERDPWEDTKQRFPVGSRRPGVVVRLETFGAFVELAPGIEGLVHVSELGAKKRIRHAREAAKLGEQVEVVVLDVDAERHRISLSLSPEAPSAADDEKWAPSAPSSGGFGTFSDLLKKR